MQHPPLPPERSDPSASLDAPATAPNEQDPSRRGIVFHGKTLKAARDDTDTIRTMVEVAKARNWKEISVRGSDAFRRNVWIEASLNGIGVRGYEARDLDRQMLAGIQQRSQQAHHPSMENDPASLLALCDAALEAARSSQLGFPAIYPDDHAPFLHVGKFYRIEQRRPDNFAIYEERISGAPKDRHVVDIQLRPHEPTRVATTAAAPERSTGSRSGLER